MFDCLVFLDNWFMLVWGLLFCVSAGWWFCFILVVLCLLCFGVLWCLLLVLDYLRVFAFCFVGDICCFVFAVLYFGVFLVLLACIWLVLLVC